MTVYILLFCFSCKSIPAIAPYTPSDCQVISVHRNIECAYKKAWEHCGSIRDDECMRDLYVETVEVQP